MTVKMHPAVKKQWLEALRSQKYKQGRGQLRNEENQFCCFGVLCDLHSKVSDFQWVMHGNLDTGYKYGGCYGVQPSEVSEWAWPSYGHTLPRVTINGKNLTLDTHNDAGRTFEEIANAIEEQL